MFELSDFYNYCKDNEIDVITYTGAPQPGVTIRDNGYYGVFLDFSKIRSARLLRGVCYHEMGHVATGALHKVDSPYELVERSEYRAKRWSAEHFLTADAFRQAFNDGCTQLWQLSEYFDLPEEDVAFALQYWQEAKGINFTK